MLIQKYIVVEKSPEHMFPLWFWVAIEGGFTMNLFFFYNTFVVSCKKVPEVSCNTSYIDWKLNTDCPLISQFWSFLVVFRENCENNKQRLAM